MSNDNVACSSAISNHGTVLVTGGAGFIGSHLCGGLLRSVPTTFADIKKSEAMLGYRPKVALDEGISRFTDWFRNNDLFGN